MRARSPTWSTTASGGVVVASVGREANAALTAQVNASTSQAAAQQALSDGLATLAADGERQFFGRLGVGGDAERQFAIRDAGQSAERAHDLRRLAEQLFGGARRGHRRRRTSPPRSTSARRGGRRACASRPTPIWLRRSARSTRCSTSSPRPTRRSSPDLQNGADVSSAEDTRDSILTQLSQQIGISTVANPDGSTSIYTDSGVTLFQDTAAHRLASPRPRRYTDGVDRQCGDGRRRADHRLLVADGHSIRRPGGLRQPARRRRAAIRRAARPDRRRPHQRLRRKRSDRRNRADVARPVHLFRRDGRAFDRRRRPAWRREIEVNANVDPSQGGNVDLLRDGGIADPTNSAYTYNTTGAASYTGRIQQLISATTIDANRSAPRPGFGTSDSLSDYANASVSWLQSQNQAASNQLDYQNSLVSQATTALSNATGVNLDTEMTNMLSIENSYTTTAKLLTTVNAMFIVAAPRRVTPMAASIGLHLLSRLRPMLSSMARAQTQLTQLTAEVEQRPVRRSRPAARRPVGLRAVAAQPDQSLATRSPPPTALTVTNLKTAQSALDSIRTTAQNAAQTLARRHGRLRQLQRHPAEHRRQRRCSR